MNEVRTDGHAGDVTRDLVTGALAGVVATAAMVATRDLMYAGESPETKAVEERVRDRDQLTPMQKPVRATAHALGRDLPKKREERLGNALAWGLGISGVTAYALLRKRVRRARAGRGLAFGTAAWLLEDELMMHGLGLTPPIKAYPWQAHARGLVSHLAYGVTAEAALGAFDRAT